MGQPKHTVTRSVARRMGDTSSGPVCRREIQQTGSAEASQNDVNRCARFWPTCNSRRCGYARSSKPTDTAVGTSSPAPVSTQCGSTRVARSTNSTPIDTHTPKRTHSETTRRATRQTLEYRQSPACCARRRSRPPSRLRSSSVRLFLKVRVKDSF